VEVGDLRSPATLARCVRGVERVFHFAAQVAVTTSLDDPIADFSVNAEGTIRLLEALRVSGARVPLLFTSTNKVYGALPDLRVERIEDRWMPTDFGFRTHGVSERRHLDFCTPYGCSKGAADQYVVDYAASFELPTVVFRMSCIYGPHQFGNEDQGWVAHFLIRALEEEQITIYGDGKQVRDVLYVDDLVDALLVARRKVDRLAGQAFNIGGGAANAVSLVQVIAMIGELLGKPPALELGPWRKGDQRWYVSDTSRFSAATGWAPQVAPAEGVRLLHDWLVAEREVREVAAA
jgi:CDP-paratose 2-epimerase